MKTHVFSNVAKLKLSVLIEILANHKSTHG